MRSCLGAHGVAEILVALQSEIWKSAVPPYSVNDEVGWQSSVNSIGHFHVVVLRTLAVVRSQPDCSLGNFLRVRFFAQETDSKKVCQ